MAPNRVFHFIPFRRDSLPLDSARTAFEWLVTGVDPLSIDGGRFPGLPRRAMPLDELRDLLLDAKLPWPTVDAVWAHLIERSRAEGGAWTVACVGMALPALVQAAAGMCKPFFDIDPCDIHIAMLTGFLTELAAVDLSQSWLVLRLRNAARHAGHNLIRDELDRTTPIDDDDFRSNEPPPPWGHPDFVLARAVAEGAISGDEAELIGSTRLEDYTLEAAAADSGVSITALHRARAHAEARLVDWLDAQAPHDDPTDRRERDVELHAVTSATITTAARTPHPAPGQIPRAVTDVPKRFSITVRYRAGKTDPRIRSQRVRESPSRPASTNSPARPAGITRRPADTTPEVPRCA
ncbi:hypothetical protein AOZ06_08365 [Kibdelosporangium phytohabitans]|uniref:Uncharacterized protein n=2 Tax=Kibdelosporangium phytohabitans TaxID=860235 RepID=A0A0N9HQD8_9PSEU|nr:hypothetical protein [Kibdelosporangium phytohabitans]ALG06938.1 hypothetical protein AOZ06_08365 [Kibdelosporangium phytohabitans]